MLGHDHEVGNRDAGEGRVHGGEQGFDGFAMGQKGGALPFADEPGEDRRAVFERKGDEEELAPGMVELHFHGMRKDNAGHGKPARRKERKFKSCKGKNAPRCELDAGSAFAARGRMW